MPSLTLFSPVSARSSTMYGISMTFATPWPVSAAAGSGSPCMRKSFGAPGTLYSYGPRCATGGVAKLPCGGGDGACHSMVVACHGLSSTFSPFLMLWKKL